MYKTKEVNTTMYHYMKDGRKCSTPNVEIAIARRDDDTEIKVEARVDDEVKHSTLVLA